MSSFPGSAAGGAPYRWLLEQLLIRPRTEECWDDYSFETDNQNRLRVTPPGGKQIRASQVVLQFEGFQRPSPTYGALHSCDNPRCVNPKHLRWGTQAENIADAVARGRAPRAQGERQWNSKLTEEQVREIRFTYELGGITQRDLAQMYGIRQAQVSAIVSRRSWKHV